MPYGPLACGARDYDEPGALVPFEESTEQILANRRGELPFPRLLDDQGRPWLEIVSYATGILIEWKLSYRALGDESMGVDLWEASETHAAGSYGAVAIAVWFETRPFHVRAFGARIEQLAQKHLAYRNPKRGRPRSPTLDAVGGPRRIQPYYAARC